MMRQLDHSDMTPKVSLKCHSQIGLSYVSSSLICDHSASRVMLGVYSGGIVYLAVCFLCFRQKDCSDAVYEVNAPAWIDRSAYDCTLYFIL